MVHHFITNATVALRTYST